MAPGEQTIRNYERKIRMVMEKFSKTRRQVLTDRTFFEEMLKKKAKGEVNHQCWVSSGINYFRLNELKKGRFYWDRPNDKVATESYKDTLARQTALHKKRPAKKAAASTTKKSTRGKGSSTRGRGGATRGRGRGRGASSSSSGRKRKAPSARQQPPTKKRKTTVKKTEQMRQGLTRTPEGKRRKWVYKKPNPALLIPQGSPMERLRLAYDDCLEANLKIIRKRVKAIKAKQRARSEPRDLEESDEESGSEEESQDEEMESGEEQDGGSEQSCDESPPSESKGLPVLTKRKNTN